ncbi:MAG: type II toxin-antitoxin system VapC family toxin [Moorella sp. (in: firmicutes)]
MNVIIDTNVIIDHLHGVPEATTYLNAIEDGTLNGLVSIITVIELLVAPRLTLEKKKAIEELLSIFAEQVPVDARIARRAAALLATYRPSCGLDLADDLIAATALVSDAVLVTRNEKHFNYITGLITVNLVKNPLPAPSGGWVKLAYTTVPPWRARNPKVDKLPGLPREGRQEVSLAVVVAFVFSTTVGMTVTILAYYFFGMRQLNPEILFS